MMTPARGPSLVRYVASLYPARLLPAMSLASLTKFPKFLWPILGLATTKSSRHSGAPRGGEPGIHIRRPVVMDSGLAGKSPRPGMTKAELYLPERFEHALRRERHLKERLRAERAERVVDRVHDAGRRA